MILFSESIIISRVNVNDSIKYPIKHEEKNEISTD